MINGLAFTDNTTQSLLPSTIPATNPHSMVAAVAAVGRHPVKYLKLAAVPILQQLQLEEALLRATSDSWFLVIDGTPDPTIVMGVSG